jgi:phage terminase small subunit
MPARRTPNAQKQLAGTIQPCRAREEADFPAPASTDPPDWLINPEAVTEWKHRTTLLQAAGVLTDADLTMLAHYCNLHAKTVGKWRANVEPTAAELTQLRLLATEFGFTPASRSKAAPASPAERTGNRFRKYADRGA